MKRLFALLGLLLITAVTFAAMHEGNASGKAPPGITISYDQPVSVDAAVVIAPAISQPLVLDVNYQALLPAEYLWACSVSPGLLSENSVTFINYANHYRLNSYTARDWVTYETPLLQRNRCTNPQSFEAPFT
ncbi:MAG: hypothetical protein AB7C90_02485 [Bacteroidales bacterium]